jgi:hypothetical protein
MSAILGYPRQMPPKYEKWLPKFTGTDAISAEEHMSNFWAFFQLHPISDDAEDLVMKLFSATLYDASRRWYLSLPDGSIKTMDRLEEAFLKRWSVKEDPNMLLTRLNNLAKYENESGSSTPDLRLYCKEFPQAIIRKMTTSSMFTPDLSMAN